jgi:hypothetical protein
VDSDTDIYKRLQWVSELWYNGEMDYQKIHDSIIDRAQGRIVEGYIERHHILPKCMGGGDEPENLVELTAREHFVVHQLLVKLNPKHYGLPRACKRMCDWNDDHMRDRSKNKWYKWLRERMSATGLSPEHKAKISAASMGENNVMYGKTHSEEAKAKMAAAQKVRMADPEIRTSLSAIMTGSTNPNYGKVFSQEIRDRMSVGSMGKTHSEETKAKMSAAKLGQKKSPEHCAAMKAGWARKRLAA